MVTSLKLTICLKKKKSVLVGGIHGFSKKLKHLKFSICGIKRRILIKVAILKLHQI